MSNRSRTLVGALALALATAAVASAQWKVPPGGDAEKNPTAVNAAMLTGGETLFGSHCARCHGKTGVGDGPSADAVNVPADLTDPWRAPLNPDGALFYKISNGKGKEMPAFASEMSKDEIWSVVEYIKTLRKPEQ